ncbi:MAG TPA: transcriptional regulator [Rubrivivax sp.]|nr:transcriptional regulator [Rubrivivax sp.]
MTTRTQRNYEAGERAPDSTYLAAFAAAGADVRYVITGARDYTPPPPLSAEEQTLVERWREASREVKNAAMGALLGAGPRSHQVHQRFAGPVGRVTGGDSHFSGTMHIDMRTKPPKRR